MNFKDQYKSPLWQKKRLEALEYYGFECSDCGTGSEQLHVHHVRYKRDVNIWDYPVTELSVLCASCHGESHKAKDDLNNLLLSHGAGFVRSIVAIISGYSSYIDGTDYDFGSHLDCVGYGAGYISNLEADYLIKLTRICPSLLQKFIEENS